MLKDAASAAGISVAEALGSIILTAGGNCEPAAKSLETPYAAVRLIKSAAERRFTLGLAYPAMRADKARAADGFRDFVSPEVLEETAWTWLTKHRDVNLFHQDRTLGHFTPTESYIWRGPNWEVNSPVDNSRTVIKAGDWMLGGIWDQYGWDLVKARLVNGWSPEGGARRADVAPERLALVEV
jgi:hypothetical protein